MDAFSPPILSFMSCLFWIRVKKQPFLSLEHNNNKNNKDITPLQFPICSQSFSRRNLIQTERKWVGRSYVESSNVD